MQPVAPTIESVTSIVVDTLGIRDRAATVTADTRLLGSLPELDSLGIVEIADALEQQFGFKIDESEFTAEVFSTIGSLTAFAREAAGSPGGS
jgi:acyl carrier protein